MKEIFKYLVASHFLPHYCNIEYTSRIKQKLRGKDGNGQPIDFTDEEKDMIRRGLNQLAEMSDKKIKAML